MPCIRKRFDKNGKYQADVRNCGKRATRIFDTKTDALKWAREKSREFKLEGLNKGRGEFDYCFARFVKEKMKTGKLPDSYFKNVNIYRRYWVSIFKNRNVNAISTKEIIEQRQRLLRCKSPATANRYLSALSAMFTECLSTWFILEKHPMRLGMVKKANEPCGRLRLPSQAELAALFDAADRVNADCGLLFRVAAATGARRSELLNLKYKDITLDDNNKIVSILFRKTKTKKYRTAFLTGGFFPVFSKRLSLYTAFHLSDSGDQVSKPLKECPPHSTRSPGLENIHIFRKVKVTQISRAIRQSGVADFHFHDFRHYFCSTLAIDGQNPSVIQSLSGHADLKNLARYSHLTPKHAVDALRQMQSKINMPGNLGAGYGV